MTEFSVLIGKVITEARTNDVDTELYITCSDGTMYRMWHDQDCCESVWLDDVVGDWEDIIGHPVLVADETSSSDDTDPYPVSEEGYTDDSHTWTFYTIRTNRGTVTLRWYGTSNGYYSEDVDFEEWTPEEE